MNGAEKEVVQEAYRCLTLIGHVPRDERRTRAANALAPLLSPDPDSPEPWSFVDDFWGDEWTGPDESICDDCGKPCLIAWMATPKLWEKVVGDYHGGTFCPACFERRCAEHKIIVAWEARPAP